MLTSITSGHLSSISSQRQTRRCSRLLREMHGSSRRRIAPVSAWSFLEQCYEMHAAAKNHVGGWRIQVQIGDGLRRPQ